MSAKLYDLAARRYCPAPQSIEVLEVAMYELANAAGAAELLRIVARITGIREDQLRRSWGGADALRVAAIRRCLSLAFG